MTLRIRTALGGLLCATVLVGVLATPASAYRIRWFAGGGTYPTQDTCATAGEQAMQSGNWVTYRCDPSDGRWRLLLGTYV